MNVGQYLITNQVEISKKYVRNEKAKIYTTIAAKNIVKQVNLSSNTLLQWLVQSALVSACYSSLTYNLDR